METFYHGTTKLFKEFDLAHAFEGDGKKKQIWAWYKYY